MEVWKEYTIDDICKTIFAGGDAVKYNPTKNKTEENNIPIYANSVENEGLYGYCSKPLVTEPAVTVAARGAGTGFVCYRKYPYVPIVRLLTLIPNENVDAHFLYYRLKKNFIKGDGSAIPQLTVPMIKKERITLPSISTQQKIAKILSSLDDKIEVNRRINEQLEELAQALFKSWFVDFEPFKDGEFVESELGMIPEGWKVGTLGELCATNKRTYGAKFSSEIAYLDTGSVTKNNIEGLQTLDPNKDKIPSRARRAVTEGDIVFSSVRPNQKHYAFLFNPQSNMVVSTGFVVITANWSGYRYFIYQYLIQEDIIAKLQAIAEQSVSTYPSINATDITNLQIVIPRRDVIGKFAEINLSFMNEIDKNQREISRLTTLRDTLLPKLMSGEIELEQLNVIE